MVNYSVGDIVYITEEGYANKRVGKVCQEKPNEIFRPTVRTPVMFPRFLAPRWFFHQNIHLANEQQRKKYFLEILKRGE